MQNALFLSTKAIIGYILHFDRRDDQQTLQLSTVVIADKKHNYGPESTPETGSLWRLKILAAIVRNDDQQPDVFTPPLSLESFQCPHQQRDETQQQPHIPPTWTKNALESERQVVLNLAGLQEKVLGL